MFIEFLKNARIDQKEVNRQKSKLDLQEKVNLIFEESDHKTFDAFSVESTWKHNRVAIDALPCMSSFIHFNNLANFGDIYLYKEDILTKFSDLFYKKSVPPQTINLRSIDGLSASKSMDEKYRSLDEFAELGCSQYFSISEQEFNRNWDWEQARILKDPMIEVYGWHDRLYLLNSGGSHHFASARYIAEKLGKNIEIISPISLVGIDFEKLKAFSAEYQVCILDDAGYKQIQSELLLSSSSVLVYDCNMNRTCDGERKVLIYRKDDEFLHNQIRLNEVFYNVNRLLFECAHRQKMNERFNNFSLISIESKSV